MQETAGRVNQKQNYLMKIAETQAQEPLES